MRAFLCSLGWRLGGGADCGMHRWKQLLNRVDVSLDSTASSSRSRPLFRSRSGNRGRVESVRLWTYDPREPTQERWIISQRRPTTTSVRLALELEELFANLFLGWTDSILASKFQLSEVQSGWRQSTDAASKARVREALNAGLTSLPGASLPLSRHDDVPTPAPQNSLRLYNPNSSAESTFSACRTTPGSSLSSRASVLSRSTSSLNRRGTSSLSRSISNLSRRGTSPSSSNSSRDSGSRGSHRSSRDTVVEEGTQASSSSITGSTFARVEESVIARAEIVRWEHRAAVPPSLRRRLATNPTLHPSH